MGDCSVYAIHTIENDFRITFAGTSDIVVDEKRIRPV